MVLLLDADKLQYYQSEIPATPYLGSYVCLNWLKCVRYSLTD